MSDPSIVKAAMYCTTILLCVWSLCGTIVYAISRVRKLTLAGGKRGHFNLGMSE